MIKKLLPLIPIHRTYVEVFGGGASLLFAKQPSPVEVYNDLNSGLVCLFRVLRDPVQFEEFHRLASLTPWSREEYDFCRMHWNEQSDPIQKAYHFFVVARQSFSGRFGASIGMDVIESHRGMAETCSKWLSIIELLPQIHKRLMRVQIERQDFRVILEHYDRPTTLFYLDPPYVTATRRSGGFEHEMPDEDHGEMIEILLGIDGKAILSGYGTPLYSPLEAAGWQRRDWSTACYAAGRTKATGILGPSSATGKQPRTESVWVSPRALRQPRLL